MKFLLPLTTLIASLLLASNTEALSKFKPGSSWNYLLGVNDENVILNLKEQVLTIDLNRRHLVPKLHSQGKKVICYFSGGTLEPHRPDKDKYEAINKNHKGFLYGGPTKWNEQYVDFRMKDLLQPLLEDRMKLAVQAGCDGIEVDCLGAYNHDEPKKHGFTKDDTYEFAKWLSKSAHKVGIAIGLKNVATLAPKLVNDFDFAVVESCSSSKNVCALFKDFPKQGKAVFTIHYGDYGSFSSQKNTMVQEQKGLGYTCTFNNDDDLKKPGYGYSCDSGSTTSTAGSVPKVEATSNTNQNAAAAANSNSAASTAATQKNVPSAVNQNGKIVGTVGNNVGNVNAPGVPITSPVPNTNSDGTVPPALNGAFGDSAGGPVLVEGDPLADPALGPAAGPAAGPIAGPVVGPAAGPAVNENGIGKVGVDDKKKDGKGSTIAFVAVAGGAATAAVAGFIFLKRSDKFTDLKRNLTRRFSERKMKNQHEPVLESISYPEESNYRYQFTENFENYHY